MLVPLAEILQMSYLQDRFECISRASSADGQVGTTVVMGNTVSFPVMTVREDELHRSVPSPGLE